MKRVRALVVALAVTTSVAGCVSMPSAGAVRSYPVTQGGNAQNQPYYLQTITGPPRPGWSPSQIVKGFLIASASFGDHRRVARLYLTSQAGKAWSRSPSWSACVYKKGPNVRLPHYLGAKKNQATVAITGDVQAYLSGSGSYAVPRASVSGCGPSGSVFFQLAKVHHQWRISVAPPELLLTSDSFRADYQLRNLYFFDPAYQFLVPDPVYVPLRATPEVLMNGLVHDLIKPPDDWLSGGATHSAFPKGTKQIGDVTLDGVTAVVNLGGAIAKASKTVMQQVSAQLIWTLVGSGQATQAVQSVEVEVNGKPWIPGRSQGNPVQAHGKVSPATGASKTFYYLDASGEVMSRTGRGKPAQVEWIGPGFSAVSVSPDGKYLAALKRGALYTGRLGGLLSKRSGATYTTMSWDPSDDLWATTGGQGSQVVMLRGDVGSKQPLGQPFAVDVYDDNSGRLSRVAGPFTMLRVAPDGVRVAIVSGSVLNFGAISWQEGPNGKPTVRIVLSPFYVIDSSNFIALTWYGPDNVITLSQPGSDTGPAVTEHPVNGGNAVNIPAEPGMRSIAASAGSPLIAGLAKGHLVSDPSLSGSWMAIGAGNSPAYPG